MSLSKENKVIIDGQAYYDGLNQPNLKFIKVNVDCWERVFDFLALRDILAMSQTCQRMRQIGGHYFRENFDGEPAISFGSSDKRAISIRFNPLERDDFLRFVDTFWCYYDFDDLRTLSSMGLLSSLTTLLFFNLSLNDVRSLENIQCSIEAVEVVSCSIGDNSVGDFLASCPKLKRLQFKSVEFETATAEASVFERTYPMLDHVDYDGLDMDQLLQLFQRNPNIKCLRIPDHLLLSIPLDATTIHLDYLNMHTEHSNLSPVELSNQLRTLHENGIFKKLRVDFQYRFDFDLFTQEMISFSALEHFSADEFCTSAMYHLAQLKELHLDDDVIDAEKVARNLVNLERLSIGGAVDQLLPFIRHSKKLEFVMFGYSYDDDGTALNLSNLNRARQMSGMRQTVQIGLIEWNYLATKRNAGNVNCDLVEIVRKETIRKQFTYFS